MSACDPPPGESENLVVWIVEDNPTYSKTLRRVVQRIARKENVWDFPDCEHALALAASGGRADVVLLDLGLPGMGGFEGLGRIKAACPDARVIVLTSFDDRESIHKAICAGASGYLLKTAQMSEILGAVRELMAGGAPMSREVASLVLAMFASFAATKARSREYHLSPRERETLEGMVAGRTAKEIAASLGVSYHTVDTYVRGIYRNLEVQSRAGAVAKALKEGLI